MARLENQSGQGALARAHHQERGLALIGLLALAPLAMTLVLFVYAGAHMIRRKSLAQSLCVQQAVRLQSEMADSLGRLLQLNPRAQSLRRQRAAADRALMAAVSSGHPAAIASARAVRQAVIAAQAALRARQEMLLKASEVERQKREIEIRAQLGRELGVRHVSSTRGHSAALAVRPSPPGSASPDFLPLEPFPHLQRQEFRFFLNLRPPELPASWPGHEFNQPSGCATTITREELSWRVQVVAASAPSR